jgi:hypothetical protein
MSRLLYAAARGARIEIWYEKYWSSAIYVRTVDDLLIYRIHPDDARLAYGPVSTALREMTFDTTLCKYSWEWTLASSATCEFAAGIDAATLATDYDLYYLFLAEFLADEGM